MAQITHFNPNARRKAVEYTGSEVIYEGMPLCYSFKSTLNWHGYSDSAGAVGDTTAEGSLNEGKFIRVEKPLRISLTGDTPADGSKTITGTTTDFDTLQVGMFVSMTGTHITDGTYRITAISRSTETGVTNSTITLDMANASGTTADVTTALDNTPYFAGVVAAGSWCGKTGPQIVEIYVPNGAIVPVRAGVDCVVGRTILALHTNEDELTTPHASYARPVAIAWETYTHSATTPGLVLAQLDPNIFIHQMGDNAGLIVDDEDTTSSVAINKMEIIFNGSATYHRALYYIANLAGGGAGLNGVFKFRTYVSSTMTSLVQGVCSNLHIQQGGNVIGGSGEFNSCFYGTIETESVTSGGFSGASVCVYQAVYYVDEGNCTAPTNAYVLGVPAGYAAGTYDFDGLLYTGQGHVGDSAVSESGSLLVGFDSDDEIRKIPVKIGTSTLYLLAGATIETATPN